MHLKNDNIQIYTILFNQQKSIKININKFVYSGHTNSVCIYQLAILKEKFCGGKRNEKYHWAIFLRQSLTHVIFIQI